MRYGEKWSVGVLTDQQRALIDRHAADAFRIAASLHRTHRAIPDDVAHDITVQTLIQCARVYDGRSRFGSFLYGCLHTVFRRDRARYAAKIQRDSRNVSLDRLFDDPIKAGKQMSLADAIEDPGSAAHEVHGRLEVHRRVRAAALALPDTEYGKAAVLCYVHGLDNAEIAEREGISIQAAANRVRRGTAHMRPMLMDIAKEMGVA